MRKTIALTICILVTCFLCGCVLIPVALVTGGVVAGNKIAKRDKMKTIPPEPDHLKGEAPSVGRKPPAADDTAQETPSEPAASALRERWALLIGINEYQSMGKLKYCREDAEGLAKVLVHGARFPSEQVIVLSDSASEPQNQATYGNIRRRVKQFTELPEKDDTILLFFAGHGEMIDGEAYLMPVDGEKDPESAIPLNWVKEQLLPCKAKTKLLVLDMCHSGSARGVGGIAPSLAQGTGLIVLASCEEDQISHPGEEVGHGVFSRYLIDGLRGMADSDGDKAITQLELFEYVKTQMSRWSFRTGKSQTPRIYPEESMEPVDLAWVE